MNVRFLITRVLNFHLPVGPARGWLSRWKSDVVPPAEEALLLLMPLNQLAGTLRDYCRVRPFLGEKMLIAICEEYQESSCCRKVGRRFRESATRRFKGTFRVSLGAARSFIHSFIHLFQKSFCRGCPTRKLRDETIIVHFDTFARTRVDIALSISRLLPQRNAALPGSIGDRSAAVILYFSFLSAAGLSRKDASGGKNGAYI